MEEKNITVLVWIQEKGDSGVCGVMISPNRGKPVGFTDAGEMVLKLDELCCQVPGLGREYEPRFLSSKAENRYGKRGREVPARYPGTFRAEASLEVRVERRMHGSLQGLVRGRATGNKYVGFRSALELMWMVSTMETDAVKVQAD